MPVSRPASRQILLCVCGGIAAYKSAELVRRLRDAGCEVQVAMTDNAQRFVGARTFQALSHRPVRTSLWDEHAEAAMRSGRLPADSGEAIIAAAREGRLPPQTTALGGAIGIHGVGRGSMKVHKAFNWTKGCIALANAQLHDFARHAAVGMRVTIR